MIKIMGKAKAYFSNGDPVIGYLGDAPFSIGEKWHPNFNGRRIAVEVVEMTEDRLTAWVEEVKE